MQSVTDALETLDHHLQAGFLAVVVIARQIRDGEKGEPSGPEIRRSVDFLRAVSQILES